MQRLIFLNRFFFPDHSATSQILSDLTFHLAAEGRDVEVVTSRLLYDSPTVELPLCEQIRGVTVHRLPTTQFGRGTLPGRALDYASFYRAVTRHLRGLVQTNDILVAKTDPPLLSIPVSRIARSRKAIQINWLHDLYPEIAVELGVPLLAGPIGAALAALRDRSLRTADANVVLGDGMAVRLRTRGVPAERIHIIPNWTDDDEITPVAPADNPLRREWGLQDHFVVGYSGNLGRAHEFETLLGAAQRLSRDPLIVFVFIGGGYQHDALARRVRELGLTDRFRFLPYQDRDQLKYSLAAPDVHWLSLKPQMEGLIFPSKLYGIAAAGRPIIAVTAKTGDIAKLVETHACGLNVEPGDADGLTQAILTLAGDAGRCRLMGQRARAMLDAHFTKRKAFERWRRVLEQVSS